MSQSKFPMRRRSLLPMALGALSVLACSQQVAPSQQQQNQQKLTPTSDGDKTIVLANQILNTYAAVTADVAAGAKTVDVDSAQLAVMGLKTGDLIMIMQMQGAQITTTDDETYGTIMNPANPNGAGRFELVQVASVDVAGGVVTVDGLCGGLKNAYRADSHSQIIRVPQFDNLTVTSAGSINPLKWDRDLGIGGVVALRAKHFRIQGSIDASGQGFAGGQEQLPLAKLGGTAAVDTFVSEDDPTVGGTKGEGIAGYSGFYGRGASANGGGGGNGFGGGGGGGGNGGLATWTGNGVMTVPAALPKFSDAWKLDPYYVDNNALSNEYGGGRGGYTQALANQDATTRAPGATEWDGNYRRERGGRGGSPVMNNAAVQIYLGGGGGAGAPTFDLANTLVADPGTGGAGGGLIYLIGGKAEGTGKLLADGEDGAPAEGIFEGGANGGGAGGTIIVNTSTLEGNLTLQANGGMGGDQPDPMLLLQEADGPGGGGGGGFIAVPATTPPTVIQLAKGGRSGGSGSQLVTEFPPNGASDGHDGLTGQSLNPQAAQTPICAPVDLRITVSDAQAAASPSARQTFLVTVYNDGPFAATAAPITGAITPAFSGVDWLCTATAPQQDVEPASCGSSQGTGDLNTTVTLPPGGTASLIVRVPLTDSTRGDIGYTATISAPPEVQDIDVTNNTSTDTTNIGPVTDLQMRVTVAPTPTTSGQPVTFILSTNNNGPNPASNVSVVFDLPAKTSVVGTPSGDGWQCSVDQTARRLTCTRAALDRGAAPDITITVLPDFGDTSVVGSARVSADSPDPDDTNNSDTAVATINFDPTAYRKAGLAGGGFGCSQVPGGTTSGTGLAGALLAAALLLVRRREQSEN